MTEPFLDRLAADLADYYRPPRWKFWRRRVTATQARAILEKALTGDPAPVRIFGVVVQPGQHRVVTLSRIQDQAARLRGKFR